MNSWISSLISQQHAASLLRSALKGGGVGSAVLGLVSGNHTQTGLGIGVTLVGLIQSWVAQHNAQQPIVTTVTTGSGAGINVGPLPGPICIPNIFTPPNAGLAGTPWAPLVTLNPPPTAPVDAWVVVSPNGLPVFARVANAPAKPSLPPQTVTMSPPPTS